MLKNKSFLGLNVSAFLMMIGVGMIVSLLPQRIVELDGNGQSVGYLASAFAISYIILQVPIGSLADKFGFKLFIILGYLLCFFTGLCFYFSNTSTMFFLSRLLQGAGEAPIWALAPALLSVKFPNSKGRVMGWYNATIHLGLTVGPLLGVILANIWGVNTLFLFYALLCFMGVILNFLCIEKIDKGQINLKQAANFRNVIKILDNKKILISLIGISLYGAGYGIFLTTIPVFLLQDKGFSSVNIGIFFSLFYVAISFSQIIIGPLADKFGPNLFMMAGLTLAAIGIIVVPILNFYGILIALTFSSLGLGIFYLSSMTFLNETVDEALKGTISGAYYLFWGIGMFFGPPILSLVASFAGFGTSLAFYAVALFIVAIKTTMSLP